MRSYAIYGAIVFLVPCYVVYTMGYFSKSTRSITLDPCPCQRELPPANLTHVLSDTTCSEHAHARGAGQKVVAFSFFEKDEKLALARKQTGDAENNVNGFFFKGFQTNIDLLTKHYPGWVIRIYHDIEESEPLTKMFCEFSCKYDYVDLCNARHIPAPLFKGNFPN